MNFHFTRNSKEQTPLENLILIANSQAQKKIRLPQSFPLAWSDLNFNPNSSQAEGL